MYGQLAIITNKHKKGDQDLLYHTEGVYNS